eukprot:COSAG05_NODE_299_length_11928_cov_3.933469_9_plen_158_part_00
MMLRVLKVNQDAELSAHACNPSVPIGLALKLVSSAAQEQRRQQSMLASGVVEPLIYLATGPDNGFCQSLTEYAALATVALIGKNERGVTLTRTVVYVVLDAVHEFFPTTAPDPRDTNFLAVKNAKATPNKIMGRLIPGIDYMVSMAIVLCQFTRNVD